MKSRVGGRLGLSVPAALGLSILLSGQAVAATWSSSVRIAADAWASSVAAVSESTSVAAYQRCVGGDFCEEKSYVKRTTNGGVTWGSRPIWTAVGDYPTLAALGSTVDLVWRDRAGFARYARSNNGGASFGNSKKISTTVLQAHQPSLARGPAGVVAVAWLEQSTTELSVRVSRNGGDTWGRIRQWPTADHGETALAVGQGVIYVSYFGRPGDLVLRRSLDNGATWSRAQVMGGSSVYDVAMAAEARTAYIAYQTASANGKGQVGYRMTTDKGSSWSPALVLTPPSWSSFDPAISLRDGTVRAVFWRAMRGGGRIYYTQSDQDTPWIAPQAILPWNECDGFGPRLDYAGRIFVVCDDEIDTYAVTGM